MSKDEPIVRPLEEYMDPPIMIGEKFGMSGGTVAGSNHTRPGQFGTINNHDSMSMIHKPEVLISVVCDGCGSAPNSEVGAKLGSKILSELIYKNIAYIARGGRKFGDNNFPGYVDGFNIIEQQFLAQISVLANSMSDSLSSFRNVINDYFLFTTVGFVVLEYNTYTFSLGDGSILVNGKEHCQQEFPGNAPPYFAFKLTAPGHHDYKDLKFNVTPHETSNIETIMSATDGVDYINDNKDLQIKRKAVGDSNQFLGRHFWGEGEGNVQKRLNILSRDVVKDGVVKPSFLKDDTTVVVAGRL